MGEMDEGLKKYRDDLYEVQSKSQNDYDKLLFAVSSGALGTSFIFVKDFLGDNIVLSWCLFGAWIFWGLAIIFNLYSYYSSAQAHAKAIKQVDDKKIYAEVPGGCFQTMTTVLNGLGGICFLVGVVLIAIFVKYNLEGKYMAREQGPKPIQEGQNVKPPQPETKGANVKAPPIILPKKNT